VRINSSSVHWRRLRATGRHPFEPSPEYQFLDTLSAAMRRGRRSFHRTGSVFDQPELPAIWLRTLGTVSSRSACARIAASSDRVSPADGDVDLTSGSGWSAAASWVGTALPPAHRAPKRLAQEELVARIGEAAFCFTTVSKNARPGRVDITPRALTAWRA